MTLSLRFPFQQRARSFLFIQLKNDLAFLLKGEAQSSLLLNGEAKSIRWQN